MATRESEESGGEGGGLGRLRTWFLLEANRWSVAAGLAVVVFASLVLIGSYGPVELRSFLVDRSPLETLFQPLLGSLITGVTIVLTINQLVLSQELGAVEDQQERMSGALSFQTDAEDVLDSEVSPAQPAGFLEALVRTSRVDAERFRDAIADEGTLSHDRVGAYVADLRSHANEVEPQFESAEFGTFEVLDAALSFDYSAKLYELRRLEGDLDRSLPDEAREAYDDLFESLKLFGIAREHFKTLYFQWELINLSRAVIYVLVPALIVGASTILFLDVDAVPGTTLGVEHLLLLVSAGVTVMVLPFLVLVSFLLRIGTMAKRTLAIGPFLLRRTDSADAESGSD